MFRDKLKKLISPKEGEQDGNDKRKIENLVFFVISLIITIVAINIIWNGKKQKTEQENNTDSKQLASSEKIVNTNTEDSSSTIDNLEKRLEEILSKIQGVGEVKVLINYSESSEVVAMYNENSKVSTTEETDTSGRH